MEAFQHEIFMHRVIQLAKLGGSSVFPNPMVGAVIVCDGKIIGEGYHQKFGQAHAEVNAVLSVNDASLLPHSTIYVSLEPCAHHGKTPPCVDLLLKEKFKRVVIGCLDPFSKVNGAGIKKLLENGVEVITPVLEKECLELNRRFFTFHQQKRPYIVLKWAESKDGFLDKLRTGEKGINRITGKLSSVRTHSIRSQEQAILVGWKTIEVDNPQLTTREVAGNNPLRIVLDRRLQSNQKAVVYTDGKPTIVLNEIKNEVKDMVQFIQTKMDNVKAILDALFELNIVSVMIEGGADTLNRFLQENCWDEIHRFSGNTLFHEGLRTLPVPEVPIYQEKLETDLLTIYQK